MKMRVRDINEFIKNDSDLIQKIAESTVASFLLEGIVLSLSDAIVMAKDSLNKIKKEKR